jgi:hypothetical protein
MKKTKLMLMSCLLVLTLTFVSGHSITGYANDSDPQGSAEKKTPQSNTQDSSPPAAVIEMIRIVISLLM